MSTLYCAKSEEGYHVLLALDLPPHRPVLTGLCQIPEEIEALREACGCRRVVLDPSTFPTWEPDILAARFGFTLATPEDLARAEEHLSHA